MLDISQYIHNCIAKVDSAGIKGDYGASLPSRYFGGDKMTGRGYLNCMMPSSKVPFRRRK